MLSSGFLPSVILKNPAHCVKAAGPNLETFKSSFLFSNFPCSSLYLTMLFATVLLIPETYFKRDGVAVFKSTPMLLTASSTTPVKLSSSLFWFTSCWYCPTPILFGSILTSSASGSWSLLAIEIAPRSETLISGYSSVASFEAEYTEAPASLTIA